MLDFNEIFNKIERNKSTNADDRILIVDGMNTYLRCWATMPEISQNGEHMGGVVGFLRSIGVNIRDFNPTKCIIVFDGKGGSQRRKKLFPEYKANRKGSSKIKRSEFASEADERESMYKQFSRILKYLTNLPVQMICLENIEADDVISYIASNYYKRTENKIRIVSTDRDFLQLIDDRVEVYSPVKKKLYDKETFISEYGMLPENYLVFRTIDGDTSDNINGVDGIGVKSMLKYFPQLRDEKVDVEQILSISESTVSESKKPKEIFKRLISGREIIERNYKLMQLHDVDISGNSKLSIVNILQSPTPKLNKYEIRKMIVEDYLANEFKNLDSWLNSTFNSLVVWTN